MIKQNINIKSKFSQNDSIVNDLKVSFNWHSSMFGYSNHLLILVDLLTYYLYLLILIELINISLVTNYKLDILIINT
jgi:hypothetical protein